MWTGYAMRFEPAWRASGQLDGVMHDQSELRHAIAGSFRSIGIGDAAPAAYVCR